MLNLSLISPKGRGFCDSPPWEGAGEVVFLFPLRGNFVTPRGCKKSRLIFALTNAVQERMQNRTCSSFAEPKPALQDHL